MFLCLFSIYVMFLLYVYMFTICSCHVVLKVYLVTYLLKADDTRDFCCATTVARVTASCRVLQTNCATIIWVVRLLRCRSLIGCDDSFFLWPFVVILMTLGYLDDCHRHHHQLSLIKHIKDIETSCSCKTSYWQMHIYEHILEYEIQLHYSSSTFCTYRFS